MKLGRGSAPAIVIPDDQTWTALADDPADRGLEVIDSPASATRVLMPSQLAPELVRPLSRLLLQVPANATFDRLEPTMVREPHSATFVDPTGRGRTGAPPSPIGERGHARVVEEDGAGPEGDAVGDPRDADGDSERAGGHGDMMAIVGEPSADGLVMESMTLRYGPLGTSLPGGLLAEVELDGDVVAGASITALLSPRSSPSTGRDLQPDALAPLAWDTAIALATGASAPIEADRLPEWRRIAVLEVERAVSHLAWLRAFGRILGWARITVLATAAIRPLLVALRQLLAAAGGAAHPSIALADAGGRVAAIVRLARNERGLRWRTAGAGIVSEQEARERGLAGPTARASGLARDARTEDPRYRRIGFAPIVRFAGDSRARALLRLDEAAQTVVLAEPALAASPEAGAASSRRAGAATVEGPRGPLTARISSQGLCLQSPGSVAARAAAADAMAGLEWSSALAVLASFDLSPWEGHGE